MASMSISLGSGLDPLSIPPQQSKSFLRLTHQQHTNESQIFTEARLLHSSFLYPIGCFISTSKPMCSKWNSSFFLKERKEKLAPLPKIPILRNLVYCSGHRSGGHLVTRVISSVSTSLLPVPLNICSNHFKTLLFTTTATTLTYVIIISVDNDNSLFISLHSFLTAIHPLPQQSNRLKIFI